MLRELQVEMIDRFGLLPQPCKNLFRLSNLKLKAKKIGISKLDANASGGTITFKPEPNINPDNIIKLVQLHPKQYQLAGQDRLKFSIANATIDERFSMIDDLLNKLI